MKKKVAKKKVAKKKTVTRPAGLFWLTRDNDRGNRSAYCGFPMKPHPSEFSKDDRQWRGGRGNGPAVLCASKWERITKTSLHLKPGGGPIAVEVRRAKTPRG